LARFVQVDKSEAQILSLYLL